MESCSLPSSTSYFAEIGLPSLALAVRPCWSGVLTPFSALASSARSLSSCGCAQLIGIAKHHATRNATADILISRIFLLSRFLMDDLGDQLDAPVLDAEPLDERLERTVLAVMAEVGAQDVERDPLAGGVGGVGERELRVRIAETPDEPGGGDAVDVRSRARHPGTPARGQRRPVAPARRA